MGAIRAFFYNLSAFFRSTVALLSIHVAIVSYDIHLLKQPENVKSKMPCNRNSVLTETWGSVDGRENFVKFFPCGLFRVKSPLKSVP